MKSDNYVKIFAQPHQKPERQNEADQGPGKRNLPKVVQGEEKGINTQFARPRKPLFFIR